MERKKVTLGGTLLELIELMAEGNPGAAGVLMQFSKRDPVLRGVAEMLHLDDMNIRGAQIWVAYKDWAGEDIEKLSVGIRGRSWDLVSVVNKNSGSEHVAVPRGASFRD